MKTSLSHFLRSRCTRVGGCLALVAAVLVLAAWSTDNAERIKLGRTWVGRLGDITWTGTYAPDPSGQKAVITLQWMTLSTGFEYMLGAVGAQSMSLASGSIQMTSPNTASGKLIWYVLASGTPSTSAPVAGQVKAIAVMTSDWHFTSPDTAEGTHNLKMYLVTGQGSMIPDDTTPVFFDQTFTGVPHLKIL